MKKLFLAILSLSVLLAMPFASASASSRFTYVSGVITSNGKVVKNAQVEVMCKGHEQSTHTNRRGQYSVKFYAQQCCKGSTVTVTADRGSQSGQNSGTFNNSNYLHLNVSFVSENLPEFGLATSIGTAILSMGMFFVIRKRYVASAIKA